MLVLGFGMGLTVAPLTATVMGAVDTRHAGLASGINNAIARAAGLLAIAALGVLLVARFDAVLDRELAAMNLPADVLAAANAERSKLAAAVVPAELEPAFVNAYLAGFRAVMFAASALAALGALAALMLVQSPRKTR
jgi:hypothetical protein